MIEWIEKRHGRDGGAMKQRTAKNATSRGAITKSGGSDGRKGILRNDAKPRHGGDVIRQSAPQMQSSARFVTS